MSKLIKLEECIITLPCKLEPIELENCLGRMGINETEAEMMLESELPEIELSDELDQAALSMQKAEAEARELLARAEKEAIEIVATAQKEAAKIVATAQKEATGLRETASQAGYQAGYTEAQNELGNALETGVKLLATIEEEWQARLAASETELLKLSVAIAKELLEAELTLNETRQLAIVQAALQRLAVAPRVNLRVPLEAVPLFEKNLYQLQTVSGTSQLIQLQADPTLGNGDFYLESSQGSLDLRIQTQLELVLREFMKLRQNDGADTKTTFGSG